MAQIEQAITSAQRRADAQYERALAEAKRTGRSQDVDGVSLSDEGLAGARIDAESHVTIDVLFNQPSYRVEIASSVEPAPARQVSIPGAVSVISVPSNVFRGEKDQERFCEAEFQVYLGQVAAPEVRRRVDERYEVTAGATPSDNAKSSDVFGHSSAGQRRLDGGHTPKGEVGRIAGTSQVASASYPKEAFTMFRLYEYNFSSTIELVTGALLVLTILAVSFI